MTVRLAFLILAGALFVAGLVKLGDVEPVQLVAVGGICLVVACVVKDGDR